MGKYNHICNNCKKEFSDYFENTKYCSRECMNEFKRNNGKLKYRNCEFCGERFRPAYSGQIFCSVECRTKFTEKKVECKCEFCGRQFFRKISEVDKNTHHYCSKECRHNAISWNDNEIDILMNNYGKISYKDIRTLLNNNRSVKEISRKAVELNLTSSREWSNDEIDILKENYSNISFDEVMAMLPKRTKSSILGQARKLNLKSFYYSNRTYTEEENLYLKENYLKYTNEELASYLNRGVKAIAQHLWSLKLYRPIDKKGYDTIAEYIRKKLIPWKNKIKEANNYTCKITGCRSNIVVHHIRGFNLILDEAIDKINFPIYSDIKEYSEEQIDELFQVFFDLQEKYHSYICISENVHKQFHNIYGYGDNTEEQWNEFLNKYYK